MTGVRFPAEARIFLFTTASRPAMGFTQPLIPGVKRPELEADNSPPPSVEVKNAWK
jgi:hypothetical protein